MVFMIIGAVVGLLGLGFLVQNTVNDPYRTLTPLDVPSYLQNANSLRGNTYRVDGIILHSLGWSPQKGRLFSVETTTQAEVLPLMFPENLNHVNLQRGQQFHFRIEVVENGLLLVRDLKKT